MYFSEEGDKVAHTEVYFKGTKWRAFRIGKSDMGRSVNTYQAEGDCRFMEAKEFEGLYGQDILFETSATEEEFRSILSDQEAVREITDWRRTTFKEGYMP